MGWNYRVVKKKLTEDENTFDVCEVYYDEQGSPTSFAENKNVLSQDTLEDLLLAQKEINKAYTKPVLEWVDKKLIEIK